jgi:hypothetical protein
MFKVIGLILILKWGVNLHGVPKLKKTLPGKSNLLTVDEEAEIISIRRQMQPRSLRLWRI